MAMKRSKSPPGTRPSCRLHTILPQFTRKRANEEALALLKRHFFEYERYDAVRNKEMMEARVDAVFLSLRNDPTFVALTSGADGKLDPARYMPAARAGASN